MSIKKGSNAPDSIKKPSGGASSGNKGKSGGNNFMLIGLLGIALVAVLIGIFSGGDDKKAPPKKEVSAAQGATGNAPKVYEKSQSRKIERSDGPGTAAEGTALQDFSNMQSLEYMNQPDTNILMVKTPTGFVVADSPEGQKFISDFNAFKAAANTGAPATGATPVQPQISEEKLNEVRQQTDQQIQALDEKVNDQAAKVEGLIEVIKKQNETIAKLSTQIRSIQPIVKTPNQLAQDLFGNNGTKVLKQRNNALVADVVVGDKAFITDINGDTHIVRVGDVIPGSSSIVSLIDESSKQVILKQ